MPQVTIFKVKLFELVRYAKSKNIRRILIADGPVISIFDGKYGFIYEWTGYEFSKEIENIKDILKEDGFIVDNGRWTEEYVNEFFETKNKLGI